ncbi:MAG TPA: AMP-binding protein [Acidimicrobiales bacterium]
MFPGLHAKERPDHPAQIWARTGEVQTYKELDDASNRLAQLLFDAGLRPGDGYAYLMENHPRYLEIAWAGQRSGLYYTAISSRLTADEVSYIVNNCDAKAIVFSHAKRDLAEALADRMPDVKVRLMVDGAIDGYDSYEDAAATYPAEPLANEVEGNDMLYSSGTTGQPKGVRRLFNPVEAGTPDGLATLLQLLWGFDEHTRYLSPAPQYHSAPLKFSLGLQRLGGTVVVMDHWDPEDCLRYIEQYRCTHGQFVPTMFLRMLKLPDEVRNRYDLSSLTSVVHAAAPCPVKAKLAMIDWWGPVIGEYYSATEGAGFCAISSEEYLTHQGSVGKALVGEIHVCDEDGNEVPTGQPGQIFFGGGIDFSYYKDDDKTEQSRHPQGWRTFGDIGYLDDEGYLYLTDRASYMIISGGVNIYPQEAENVLSMHPKVHDVAVIGVPNEDFGEEVKAVVQPSDWEAAGPDLERELISFCREHLADVKCPRSVDFDRELPRADTGKLYKRLIRDRYWEGDRRISG